MQDALLQYVRMGRILDSAKRVNEHEPLTLEMELLTVLENWETCSHNIIRNTLKTVGGITTAA